MPPKFESATNNSNGRPMGRGGGGGGGGSFYKRSNHRRQGRFDSTYQREAGDVLANNSQPHQQQQNIQVMKRNEETIKSDDQAKPEQQPQQLTNSELDTTSELDKLKETLELAVEKLSIEIVLLKERLRILESASGLPSANNNTTSNNNNNNIISNSNNTDKQQDVNKNKPFYNNKNPRRRIRNRHQHQDQQQQQPQSTTTTKQKTYETAPTASEDRPEGDDQNGDGKERRKVFRRKKRFNQRDRQRGPFAPNRRRADSSDRNSNDTSPQENGNNQSNNNPIVDTEEFVQNIKRDFLHSDRKMKNVYEDLTSFGPTIIYEFFVSILEHVICDVTSRVELSGIAYRIYLMMFKENLSQHQESFVNALNNISNREEDLAIDAPRYMDSLGQFLAENLVLMFPKDDESDENYKVLLLACLDKYKPESRGNLLASIMTAMAETRDERFAKDFWNKAKLNWIDYVAEENLALFLETNSSISFTTSDSIPEEDCPPDNKNMAQRLEIFADDITAMVERKKVPEELLERWTQEKEKFGIPDEVAYYGNLIYGIVRGCLVLHESTCDGVVVEVDHQLLHTYDPILSEQRDKQDEIALFALTLITKLWYIHKCPKDMFINILSALHCVHKTTTNTSLRRWLEDKDLHSIPGIGAARLHCKRFIDDVTGSN